MRERLRVRSGREVVCARVRRRAADEVVIKSRCVVTMYLRYDFGEIVILLSDAAFVPRSSEL